jgi:hypothetical protein
MVDFIDVREYSRHFNFQKKIGEPGDTQILVSGIERPFTDSIYAKMDSLQSGIDGIDLSGMDINVDFTQIDTALEFQSGKLSTIETELGAKVGFVSGKLSTIQDEMGIETLQIDNKCDYLSGETSYLKAQAGANTKIITDRIEQVVLGQVWNDAYEPSGSHVEFTYNEIMNVSGFVLPDIKSQVDICSGILGILPTSSVSINLTELSGTMVQDVKDVVVEERNELSGLISVMPQNYTTLTVSIDNLSGCVTEDIKDTIVEKRNEISGLLSVMPQNHTELRNQVDFVSGKLSLIQDEAGIESQNIDDAISQLSGMLLDINLELDTVAIQAKLDLVSGIVSVIPNDLTSRSSQVSVDYLSGQLNYLDGRMENVEETIITEIESVSGMVADLNLELDGIASQISVDLLSGMVGILPGDLTSRASQVSSDLISGMIGVLPGVTTQISVEFISGKLSTLENEIKPFRYTTFVKKSGTVKGLISGEYVTLFADSAYKDTKIKAFTIDDDGVSNGGMRIASGATK